MEHRRAISILFGHQEDMAVEPGVTVVRKRFPARISDRRGCALSEFRGMGIGMGSVESGG